MDSFRIRWKRSAAKELGKLPKEVIPRVVTAVERLADEPFPAGARKLAGSEHSYRIRIGSYRVIYDVESAALIIEIVRVAHRRQVYDR